MANLRNTVWPAGTCVVAALVATPIVGLLTLTFESSPVVWSHLLETVFWRYVSTTLYLALGVGLGVLILGVGTAWLVTMFHFPGSSVLHWALLLPLAMPTYLAAYAYTDLLEYAGPVQTTLRQLLGWTSRRDYWFPEIRSLGGAISFMTLVLYPYVYLLSRSAFIRQSREIWEAARVLGRSPYRCFLSVGLPLARPAIATGVFLALMETLNDFGTVDYFAVQTLTVGIYRLWFGMNDTAAAAQLASLLLGLVLVLLLLEKALRTRRRYQSSTTGRPIHSTRLEGIPAVLAYLACLAPVVLGFVVPSALMLAHTLDTYDALMSSQGLALARNSLTVASSAAVVCVIVGLFLSYGNRVSGTAWINVTTRVASSGYTVPGIVLAVGVIIPTAYIDNTIDLFMRTHFGITTGLLLNGTVAALIFAYVVRFLALSFGSLESGLTKITPNMDEAARSLGTAPSGVLLRIHLPLLRGSVLTAIMLVFVDTMKELPMTLVLRPFNFNTLSTHVYEYASYEAFEQAAPAALAIVVTGLIPVIILSRSLRVESR